MVPGGEVKEMINMMSEKKERENFFDQYKSKGLSFRVPVAGSRSKPKDSKTTTPKNYTKVIYHVRSSNKLSIWGRNG